MAKHTLLLDTLHRSDIYPFHICAISEANLPRAPVYFFHCELDGPGPWALIVDDIFQAYLFHVYAIYVQSTTCIHEYRIPSYPQFESIIGYLGVQVNLGPRGPSLLAW